MADKKRAQHYVPQSYIKKFYDKDKCWVLDFEKLKNGYSDYLQSKTSAEICYGEYFYDIDKDFRNRNPEYAHLDTQHIENATLRRLENKYGAVFFPSITERFQLTHDECNAFVDFMIQMKIRNPYYRNNDLKNNATRLIGIAKQQIQHDSYFHEKFKNIPNAIKDTLFKSLIMEKYDGVNFERNLQLSSLITREENINRSTILKDVIPKHPWILASTLFPNSFFLTTDNPGASVSPRKPNIVFNTKFNEDFVYYFPLSPFYCFIIDGTRIDTDFFDDPSIKKIQPIFLDPFSVMKINNELFSLVSTFSYSGIHRMVPQYPHAVQIVFNFTGAAKLPGSCAVQLCDGLKYHIGSALLQLLPGQALAMGRKAPAAHYCTAVIGCGNDDFDCLCSGERLFSSCRRGYGIERLYGIGISDCTGRNPDAQCALPLLLYYC